MARDRKAHAHNYRKHPDGSSHYACTVCGFSIPTKFLGYAVEHGATLADPIVLISKQESGRH